MHTYQAQLLGTTALVHPTHHKSIIGSLFGLAASIAIPFAAPAIAAALSVSQTLVQIGLGAAVGFATGGVKGALLGGIGGAFSGITSGAAGATASGASNAASSAARAGLRGITSGAAQAATGSAGLTAASSGARSSPGFNTNAFASAPTPLGGPPGSFTGTAGGSFVGAPDGFTTAQSVSGIPTAGTTLSGGAAIPAGRLPGGVDSFAATGPQVGGVTPGGAANINRAAVLSGASPAPGGGVSGFIDNAGNFLSGLPEPVKAGLSKAGSAFASNIFVDKPELTAEERLRSAQLDEARAIQLRLLNEREGISNQFLQEANNIDPQTEGLFVRSARLRALGRGQRAGLRQTSIGSGTAGNRRALAAEKRRNALDRSKTGGFESGFRDASSRRLQAIQAASSSAPTGAGLAATDQAAIGIAGQRFERLAGARQEASDTFQPIFDGIFNLEKDKNLRKGAR